MRGWPRAAQITLGLLLSCSAGCSEQAPAVDTRPDLILVVVDTLRADRLSTYGHARPTSPNLDQLAARGVVFEDATAQSSWTLPSMTSLFTGRHVFVNAERLPDGVPALAERLAEAGYDTAAFIGNPAVSAARGFDRGFATFIGREQTGNVTWTAPDLQAALEGWLAKRPRDGRPLFLYLHFMDPHFPYAPVAPETLPGQVTLRDDTLAAWVAAVTAAKPGSPLYDTVDQDRRHILGQIDAYDREIATMDRVLAEILDRLAALRGSGAAGGRQRLVAVAADHGEGLWDHAHHAAVVAKHVPPEQRTLREVFFRDHSYHLFQELIHTPLLLSGAGFPAGRRIEQPVENVDLVPTLLRAAGLPEDPALDGVALQDVCTQTARPRTAVFAHCNEGTVVRDVETSWKLIFPTATGDSFGMPMQLYHLDSDPYERKNRATDKSALPVLKRLIRLREEAAEAFDLFDSQPAHIDDPEQEALLIELGYVHKRR
ncbi:MAG: sulfatase [Planctomycetota bacterium]